MDQKLRITRLQHAFAPRCDSCPAAARIEKTMNVNQKSMGPSTDHGMPEQLLTRNDVAEWLQISPKTLANRSSCGLGPTPLKLHGFVRYERATVRAWILATGYARAAS
jgi:predicted DNA-binding transcriptional regulator AlpA